MLSCVRSISRSEPSESTLAAECFLWPNLVGLLGLTASRQLIGIYETMQNICLALAEPGCRAKVQFVGFHVGSSFGLASGLL